MMPPLPLNEVERLAALLRYEVLDTPPEPAFDDIVRLAAQICDAPTALISLIDETRQWFKARLGFDRAETPREHAFCAYTITAPHAFLEVPDARQDDRFADHPLVVAEPFIRFYAGASLIDPDGLRLGTLCVIDREPRALSEPQRESLRILSRQVVAQLELRRRARELDLEVAERRRAEERGELKRQLLEAIREAESGFITSGEPRRSFSALLSTVLSITGSEYGFIGEVLHDAGGPYLRAHAISNIAWSPEWKRLYAEHEERGLEFRNLSTLFGEAIRTGAPVIANEVTTHATRGGLPPGHPPLRAFLGLPLFHAGELVGLVGAANRPGGYDETLCALLEPLLSTCANLIAGWRAERRRQTAERALRASEERLLELTETLEDVFWITNPTKTRIEYISPGYELTWGRPRDELFTSPQSWLDAIHPDDRDRVVAAALAQHTGRPYVEEYRIVRPDGAIRWIRDHAFRIMSPTGDVLRIVGAAKDITAQRLAEDGLRATNERYARQEAALLTMTRACVMGPHDFGALVREVCEIAATTLQVERVSLWRYSRSRHEITCQELYERSTGAHASGLTLRAHDYPRYFSALAEGDIIVAHDANLDERTAEFSDAYLRPLGISSMLDAPIHVAGQVAGVVCSEHVGPPRKWTADEQTFAIAVANLVSLLLAQEERIAVEEQLRQSQKMEAIGRLAGGVAHDFNNILLAILLQLDLVDGEPDLSIELREGLEEIRLSAQRATALTRQLLLFSRRQVMQARPLDLNDVVTGLSQMLQRIIGEDVRLQLELHPTALPTFADAGMLEQILLNLAVNARDAMPDGGRLRIHTSEALVDGEVARLHPDAEPGRYVCVGVHDTGGGIPREVLPRIFEPFFTTKDPGKGTGLGLATVLGIVKLHRGWIDVHSDPGDGASFSVYLPAGGALVDAADPAARVDSGGGDETILLVEDDRAVLRLARGLLERHGYRVLEALNGVDALSVWAEHAEQISLLVTDLVMPAGIDGVELARRCRGERPDLKVIYTSGYGDELTGREPPHGGHKRVLHKPFAPEDLLDAVRGSLDGHHG